LPPVYAPEFNEAGEYIGATLDLERLTTRRAGDITGAFNASGADDETGAGAGAKRRKWRGAGKDRQAERARAESEFEARLPHLVAEFRAENEFGNRLLLLGKRAAGKAARQVLRLRGVMVSDTSLAEAEAEATHGALFESWDWQALFGVEPIECPLYARRMGLIAWRAAYRSLTERTDGIRARRGAQDSVEAPPVSIPLDEAGAETARASLKAWEWTRFSADEVEEHGAKHEASAWVWGALVTRTLRAMSPAQRSTPAGQARIKAHRARAVCLIRMIHGASFVDAARLSGFASTRAAAESLRSGKVADVLQAQVSDKLPALRRLVASLRSAGLRAGRAVKRARARAELAGAAGTAGTVQRIRRTYRNASAGRNQTVRQARNSLDTVRAYGVHFSGRMVETVTERPALIVSPLVPAYGHALDERARALDWALFCKARLEARRASVAEDFAKVFKGLWRGDAAKAPARRGPSAGYVASGVSQFTQRSKRPALPSTLPPTFKRA
jgi:hypothetical protein